LKLQDLLAQLRQRNAELDELSTDSDEIKERASLLRSEYLELEQLLTSRLADLQVRLVAGRRVPTQILQLVLTLMLTSLGLILCHQEVDCAEGELLCRAGDWWCT